jgi:hypothetical protein
MIAVVLISFGPADADPLLGFLTIKITASP